jgi:hypothetical protein
MCTDTQFPLAVGIWGQIFINLEVYEYKNTSSEWMSLQILKMSFAKFTLSDLKTWSHVLAAWICYDILPYRTPMNALVIYWQKYDNFKLNIYSLNMVNIDKANSRFYNKYHDFTGPLVRALMLSLFRGFPICIWCSNFHATGHDMFTSWPNISPLAYFLNRKWLQYLKQIPSYLTNCGRL